MPSLQLVSHPSFNYHSSKELLHLMNRFLWIWLCFLRCSFIFSSHNILLSLSFAYFILSFTGPLFLKHFLCSSLIRNHAILPSLPFSFPSFLIFVLTNLMTYTNAMFFPTWLWSRIGKRI